MRFVSSFRKLVFQLTYIFGSLWFSIEGVPRACTKHLWMVNGHLASFSKILKLRLFC